MKLLNKKSLSITLDNVNDCLSDNTKIDAKEKLIVAEWISSRQGIKGSYSGMFAPTEWDFDNAKVYTGEKLNSRASISHILGEEASRTLRILNVRKKAVSDALHLANEIMMSRLKESESAGHSMATYCCGICTCSYWRNLASGGLEKNESRLKGGVKKLAEYRDGSGRWKRFPYYYTLSALNEIYEIGISPRLVKSEMKYASAGLERLLRKKPTDKLYDCRRRTLAERVMAKL